MKPNGGWRSKYKFKNVMVWLAKCLGWLGAILSVLSNHQKKNITAIWEYIQASPIMASLELTILSGCVGLILWESWNYWTSTEVNLDSYRKVVNNYVGNILKIVNGDMPTAGRATVYLSDTDLENDQKHYYYALGRSGNTNGDLNRKKWWFYEAENSVLHQFQRKLKNGETDKICITPDIESIMKKRRFIFFKISRSTAWKMYWKKRNLPSEYLHSRLKPEWFFGIKMEFPDSNRFVILLFESQLPQDENLEKKLNKKSKEIKSALEALIECAK